MIDRASVSRANPDAQLFSPFLSILIIQLGDDFFFFFSPRSSVLNKDLSPFSLLPRGWVSNIFGRNRLCFQNGERPVFRDPSPTLSFILISLVKYTPTLSLFLKVLLSAWRRHTVAVRRPRLKLRKWLGLVCGDVLKCCLPIESSVCVCAVDSFIYLPVWWILIFSVNVDINLRLCRGSYPCGACLGRSSVTHSGLLQFRWAYYVTIIDSTRESEPIGLREPKCLQSSVDSRTFPKKIKFFNRDVTV